MGETNPNGANQFQLDPRQKLCWDFYIDPKSETFGNATQSAIKAGYGVAYADIITQADWFGAKLWRLNSVVTGEKKLKELLELDLLNGGDKVDVGIAKIQADIAKLLVTTQGRNEGYSTKTETDIKSDGKAIQMIPPEIAKKLTEVYEEEMKKELT